MPIHDAEASHAFDRRWARDVEREPSHGRVPPGGDPLRSRRGFQASVIDMVNAAAGGENNRRGDYTIRLTCLACGGPVFVPSDSDRERVTCADERCLAEYTTRRTIDSVAIDRRESSTTDTDGGTDP